MKRALPFVILVVFFVLAITGALYLRQNNTLDYKLTSSITRQGNWYIRNQNPEGDFVYERYVQSGDPTQSKSNIVRQAGALYGLAQLHRLNRDPEILKVLEKGFDYFQKITVPQNPTASAIVHNNRTYSNTTALVILGLSEYIETDESFRTQKNLEYLTALSNYLVLTQMPNGAYTNEYTANGPVSSDYNNGETMYALAKSYNITKNEIYLTSIKRFANFAIAMYGNQQFNSAYFSWGMAGFAHLYNVTNDERYWEFLKSYSDKYFKSRGEGYELYLSNKGPEEDDISPGVSVFIEGVDHLAWAAKSKDEAQYVKLKTHIENVLSYLSKYEINSPNGKFRSTNDEVTGAICSTPSCETTRIDFLQHNISAIILYLRYVK